MFQNVRKGTPIYLLHRNEAKVEIGEVVGVSMAQPLFNHSYQNGQYLQPKNVVDIQVSINGKTINLQKLPADATIADDNGMVVSESRDAILTEIDILKKNSQKMLESMDYHKEVVAKCEALCAELNPHLKKEVEQAKEMNVLRDQVSSLRDDMVDIKSMLTKFLNKKKED